MTGLLWSVSRCSKCCAQGLVTPSHQTLLPGPPPRRQVLQVKRLGLVEAPRVLAWCHSWARLAGWTKHRVGVWGELLPRVREPRGGYRSAGSRQIQAVLLGQEVLLEDLAARGWLSPVAWLAGLAMVWIRSAPAQVSAPSPCSPTRCPPFLSTRLAGPLPQGPPCCPCALHAHSCPGAIGILAGTG